WNVLSKCSTSGFTVPVLRGQRQFYAPEPSQITIHYLNGPEASYLLWKVNKEDLALKADTNTEVAAFDVVTIVHYVGSVVSIGGSG
ncbi:hypothetical protein CCACVL1_23963, partial [Corchorus capsularis]